MGRGQGRQESGPARGELHGGGSGTRRSSEVEFIDDRIDYEEERLQTLCMGRGRILFIVTTMRAENLGRIISAPKGDAT
jgi:uncharacterized DUF497 family protein